MLKGFENKALGNAIRRKQFQQAQRTVLDAVNHGFDLPACIESATTKIGNGIERRPGESMNAFMGRATGLTEKQVDEILRRCMAGEDLHEVEAQVRARAGSK